MHTRNVFRSYSLSNSFQIDLLNFVLCLCFFSNNPWNLIFGGYILLDVEPSNLFWSSYQGHPLKKTDSFFPKKPTVDSSSAGNWNSWSLSCFMFECWLGYPACISLLRTILLQNSKVHGHLIMQNTFSLSVRVPKILAVPQILTKYNSSKAPSLFWDSRQALNCELLNF